MRRKIKSVHCHLLQQTGVFFLVSEYILTVSPPILDRFSQIILLKSLSLWSKPSTGVLRKSHRTGRCLASQICNRQFTTKCSPKIIARSKRAILKLSMKNDSCLKIKLDRSDYHRLKQLLQTTSKWRFSYHTKFELRRAMHTGRQSLKPHM
jgi:hypothetical protein